MDRAARERGTTLEIGTIKRRSAAEGLRWDEMSQRDRPKLSRADPRSRVAPGGRHATRWERFADLRGHHLLDLALLTIHTQRMDTCGRCHDAIDTKRPQICVWCKGDLCVPCWEALGHCGHPEMDAINADMQTASPARRRAMMQVLGPTGGEGESGEQLDDDLPDRKAN